MVLAATVICGACLLTSCKKDENLKLEEKIIGKWILAETNGKPTPTNNKYVVTFTSPTKGYRCASFNEYAGSELETLWNDRQEFDYTIEGNVVTITMMVNDHLTVVDEMKVSSITDSEVQCNLKVSWMVDGTVIRTVEESIRAVKVTYNYREAVLGMWECQELTGIETYNNANARLEFFADGTYNYWRKNTIGARTLPANGKSCPIVNSRNISSMARCWPRAGRTWVKTNFVNGGRLPPLPTTRCSGRLYVKTKTERPFSRG